MSLICETLKNNNGIEAKLLNLGAALISLSVPAGDGERADLTLGYDNNEDYYKDSFYFGSTPGRFANRIGSAAFSLDGRVYDLPPNENRNQLHGGATGFSKKLWDRARENGRVTFTYVSPDGESGYPGTLTAKVSYTLNDENELVIEYAATSDKDTVINLTNHAYFNLGGGAGTILNHLLKINADSFIVTDKENIPTGEIRKTAGSVMDFTEPARLADVVYSDEEAIRNFSGLDSCFKLNGEGLRSAAVLADPDSGRRLEVLTDLPGLQIYSGQYIPENTKGRGGLAYGPFGGVCLEAQHFPDAPNRPEFPSAVLRKGDIFSAKIIYRFTI